MVVDRLAKECGSTWKPTKDKALAGDFPYGNAPATLLKPLTYMNLSGTAVVPALRRLNADPARMIVIHDDLDIPFGRVRIKVGGGDGGHKGVRSLADSLRFRNFTRVRVGIGRPPDGVAPDAFVLLPFEPEETGELDNIIATAADAVKRILTEGVAQTQNVVHSKQRGTWESA